ncbi:hypothetical protein CP97_14779 [Aurantiacibacter atlanticus]|uniref:Uncharacterized protein n=1 Tax=Aurantiacibacter atlanticus TaxID=1648404 RepID=A0A168M2A8_9SPHN|nr:hypothetical protein CP97_14779 [Aurantiacibacter atlanticus]
MTLTASFGTRSYVGKVRKAAKETIDAICHPCAAEMRGSP